MKGGRRERRDEAQGCSLRRGNEFPLQELDQELEVSGEIDLRDIFEVIVLILHYSPDESEPDRKITLSIT
ncbi:uncharacterized [Tachysurus ichikawai]